MKSFGVFIYAKINTQIIIRHIDFFCIGNLNPYFANRFQSIAFRCSLEIAWSSSRHEGYHLWFMHNKFKCTRMARSALKHKQSASLSQGDKNHLYGSWKDMQLATPYLFNFYIDFPPNNNVFFFQPSIFDIFDKIDCLKEKLIVINMSVLSKLICIGKQKKFHWKLYC